MASLPLLQAEANPMVSLWDMIQSPEKCLSVSLKSGSWHIGYNLCHVNSEDPNLGQLRAGTTHNLQVFLCALS